MQINKKDLQEALEIVKPGLANREVIEQTTSFAFMEERVVTYNNEISISHPIKDLKIKGAIQADKLYALLSKVKKDIIDITTEGNEIILSSGRMKAGLTLQSEIKLPLEDIPKIKEGWKDLPENFIKCLRFAMSACGKDMSRPILTCVHINKNGYMEASDNLRIIQCRLSSELPVKTFLIPASAAVDVVKLNPIRIAKEQEGWVHFQTEMGTIISCRIFGKDKYVSTSSRMEVKQEQEIIFPGIIQEVLDRAIVFAKRDYILDEIIEISLENRRLKLRSFFDEGWFEEEINIRYTGDPISFSITPYLLKDILSESSKCIISKEKIKFEGDDWIYVATLRN